MPEGAGPRWNAAQQAMLREMGFELLDIRRSREGGSPGANTPRDAPGLPPPRERRLVMLSSESPLRGPHATLVRNLLRTLGVREEDVRGEPQPGTPTLAFGLDAPDAIRAPSLAELRTAAAKRALWPQLRALRKHFRS